MPKNTKTEKVSEVVEVKAAENNKKVKASKAGVETPKEVVAPVVAPVVTAPVEVKVTKKTTKVTKAVETPKVEAKVEDKVEVEEVAQEGGKRRVRYFRCVYSDDTFGRFSGYKPKQAAGKALTSILRHREKEGQDLAQEVTFSMVECTRGGSHKVSQYTGKRVKLEKPVTVTIKTSDGKKKEINYNFTNKISKVKADKKVAAKTEKKSTKKSTTKKTTTKKTTKKVAKKSDKKQVKKTTTKKSDA